jgi:hypothetical protein
MGAGIYRQFRQGGWRVSSFLFFPEEERKESPPHGAHAWVRLATNMGARMPQISLTLTHLTQPGPA